MESCKYHPVSPSSYTCSTCATDYCSDCVDLSVPDEARCFICGAHLDYHVISNNVEPFWRRLEKAFRYPLNTNALMMIFGLSVISTTLTALPFQGIITLILGLIILGGMVNYSFMCLTQTSEGNMIAPNIKDAFEGTIGVLFKLLLMTIIIGVVVFSLAAQVSPFLAMLIGFVILVGLPAILMCFAHTGSVIESLNPINFVRLMYTVGLPYWVLIIFLLIMLSSISVLNQIIGDNLLALSAILQSSVTNYYAVVMFHLMGYLLYQYQDRLGFSTSDTEINQSQQREPADVILAHVNVRLKEGDYKRVDELLKNGIDTSRHDKRLWSRYFDFLYRTENKASLQVYADKYLRHLIETAQTDKVASDYKKIKQIDPKYLPKHPEIRFQVASGCRMGGDSLSAVQLINGLHREFPNYEKLISAYQLMKLSLDDLPNMKQQVEKCTQLIEHLKKKYPQQEQESPVSNKAVYEVKEPIEQAPKPKLKSDDHNVSSTVASESDNKTPTDLAPIEFK